MNLCALNVYWKRYPNGNLSAYVVLVGLGTIIPKLLPQAQVANSWFVLRKTEIAYPIAGRYKHRRGVFFFDATDSDALEDCYREIIFDVGHDALVLKYPRFHEAHAVWTSLNYSGQLDAIKRWLGSEANSDSLIIFDDLDGLGCLDTIRRPLPKMSGRFIYTCRDPTLYMSPLLQAELLSITPLRVEEAVDFLTREMSLNGSKISRADAFAIAEITGRHPLTMRLSVQFIHQVLAHEQQKMIQSTCAATFMGLFPSEKWESRRNLLDMEMHGSLSLMQSFKRSLDRMESTIAPTARQVLELIAFISPPYGSPAMSHHYTEFFILLPWLSTTTSGLSLLDHELLKSGLLTRGTIFAAIRKVSIIVKSPSSHKDADIFPLWLECARQQCEHQKRILWIQQLLSVCFHDLMEGDTQSTAKIFIENILSNARTFGILIPDPSVHLAIRTGCI